MSTPRQDPDRMATAITALHDRCGIYTLPELVDEILDGVGWTARAELSTSRLLEPGAGDGAFAVEAASRLVESFRHRAIPTKASMLTDRIRAFELHPPAAAAARRKLRDRLHGYGLHTATVKACVEAWIVEGDFILEGPAHGKFTHVVGNPPYIRWSKIPADLKTLYSGLLPKDMTGGDLFVPFLDRSMDMLLDGGRCGFVCSDRWRFMAFGRSFRNKWLPRLEVRRETPVKASEAFVTPVDAYPSVLIAKKRSESMRCVPPPNPFTMGPTLEEFGCTVRVGPALGCTPAFVLEHAENDVEPELLQPWLDPTEVKEGTIDWRGRRVVTMHHDDERPVDPKDYPMLAHRLDRYKIRLGNRTIVRRGAPWYRTIDRVRASDWLRPKLLVPELAKVPRLAIDRTGAIPSHGVYAIFAPDDDVDALYEKLRDGRLARALEGIAPKVKGEYVRCYKRFLLKIAIPG